MPRARLVFDGDGVYTEKEARIHKLTQETETKIDNIPGVVDDVNSTSTTDALSANMGKVLQDQINQLTGLNKFLSTWDCTTGLPVTDPSATPFTYTSGNYYLVATVAGEGETNYKPHGSTFTPGVASTAVETNEVNVNDMYIFDGSQWILQVNKVKEIIVDDGLSPDSTNAVENRAIYSALTTKQDKLLDINDIRTGAALGATSLQPGDNITELTNNVGYQTAGDVAAAISQVAVDVNTKTFTLSGLSGATALTEAQAIYDWHAAGKNPIVIYDNKTYVFSGTTNGLTFNEVDTKTINYDSGSNIVQKWIRFLDTAGEVTSIISGEANRGGFLALSSNYVEPYTPLYNGSPATKKYVDDSITSATEGNKYVGPTAPSNPTEGQLWYDTTNDVLKVYDGTQWNLTGKVYSAGTGINISNADEISNTGVLSINGDTGVITGIATESYVNSAVDSSIHSGSTAPTNPEVGTLWYDTVNNVLKVWNGTSWTSIQELLINGVNIKTVNNHDLLGSGNIDIIGVEEIQFVTQTEYDNLPSSKTEDGKAYFIYSGHGAAIVSDEAFSSSWNGITTQAPSKNAVYDKIQSIEGDIEGITTGGASTDHLELAAMVGELYNINSELFLQETPTYINSTGAQNVGSNTNDKEVHIQRIGSGNSNGNIKLKVRMVGTATTDLVVEVREGVQQTVSSTEAWWYGNPNQIIASGTIPHGQITSSWAEYNVVLNTFVGGNRGQLLDVVVYQTGKTVSSTNYYQIAYDESQYTETYRIITYNDSAYTKTDKAGYCISNAFADKLLCKVGETQETTMTATTISGSSGWADNQSVNQPTVNFTATDTTGVAGMGKYIVYINCREVNHTSGCFLEGAKITMADGNIKNIEDIMVGDEVLSYNVATNEYEPHKVTVVLNHIFCINDINKIYMGDDILDIAGIHPVYAVKKGSNELEYIPANKLEIGDKIFTNGGELKEITDRSEYKYLDRLFNFAVEGTHNCFVEGCLTVFE